MRHDVMMNYLRKNGRSSGELWVNQGEVHFMRKPDGPAQDGQDDVQDARGRRGRGDQAVVRGEESRRNGN